MAKALAKAAPRPQIGNMTKKDDVPKKPAAAPTPAATPEPKPEREIGGPAGPEPTRYGDWEIKGRCSDF